MWFLKINDSNTILESFENHNHDKPEEKTLSRQKISSGLKRGKPLKIFQVSHLNSYILRYKKKT
jgi:hypothetical protein